MSSMSVNPDGVRIPLTTERKQQIAGEIADHFIDHLRDGLIARGQETIARGQALAERGDAKIAQADAKKSQAEALQRSSEAHFARAAQLRAQQEKIKIIISSQIFYGVFHDQVKPSVPVIQEIYSKYLARGDVISILRDPETKQGYFEAKTTVPFAQYLEANPGVTTCDFRIFRNIFDNMEHVARALSEGTCSVNAVWINNTISEDAKAYLDKAVRARNGALAINYV